MDFCKRSTGVAKRSPILYDGQAIEYWLGFAYFFPAALLTAVVLSWIGSEVPDRWLLLAFGVILFVLAFVFIRYHQPRIPCPC